MPNRLAAATSPYLLQHQDNPVDWHEWGDDAFAEASSRDVPVLLSVGYSACHWCHVMAHESFEDADTASQMNRQFVNVKVDREERPDVDAIYMEAVQTMTGRGGWPMTVWLTPEGKPFYAGTYFPNRAQHGMPAFTTVMDAVSDAWANRREEVLGQSARLTEAIGRSIPSGTEMPGEALLHDAHQNLAADFDPVNGGFGGAPKFPQQPVLEFLLRTHREPWALRAGDMLERTLSEMADGGIHDQLGGGFARYSVDAQWLVPHFEKMLYDNAQLARIYLWAGIELDQPRFVDVARSILEYLTRDLRHADGGFFSAEDADSEGEEGRFYVWTVDELEQILGQEDAVTAARFFGCTPHGNFEGANVLHLPTGEPWHEEMESIRQSLLHARSARVRPGLDDKVVASWNGLAIRAFAEAGAALDEPGYVDVASATARFVLAEMVVDGVLRRTWRQGKVGVPGFLEDHAAMALGLFALYQATGEFEWFGAAERLTLAIPDRFADKSGFFDTPIDGETLVKRPKSLADNPMPSGNAMAAEALLTLSSYTGRPDEREHASGAIQAAAMLMERFPSMVGHHLSVLYSFQRSRELAIVGPEWRTLARVHWESFRPTVVLAPSADGKEPIPIFEGRSDGESTRAYLCRGHVCDLPRSDPTELAAALTGPD